MSASISSSADAISILAPKPAPESALFLVPDAEQMRMMRIDYQRYLQEMNALYEGFEDFIKPLFTLLNELPESPETKALKRDLNDALISPALRARDPKEIGYFLVGTLSDIIRHYHESRVRPKKTRAAGGPTLDLAEIVPENLSQERAMALLRVLKAKPKEALHTDDCCKILSGAEGKAIDATMARRAMRFLSDTYAPALVLEKVDGSQRIRTNF